MGNKLEPSKRLTVLASTDIGKSAELYNYVLLKEEKVLFEFKAIRDVLVLTDRKIIAVDVQGITGKKKEILIVPYSKITAFSTETAGTFDLDLEIKIWASGIGLIEFEFVKGTNNFPDIISLLAHKIN